MNPLPPPPLTVIDDAQTSGVEVIVAPVPVPDTTAMVELFLFDTAGNDLYKDSVSQVRYCCVVW